MTNFELIDKYINNELSAEEKLAFELSLTQNTELNSDLDSDLTKIKTYLI